MRPALDHWLGRPSTLCFLRRLLAAHGTPQSVNGNREFRKRFSSFSAPLVEEQRTDSQPTRKSEWQADEGDLVWRHSSAHADRHERQLPKTREQKAEETYSSAIHERESDSLKEDINQTPQVNTKNTTAINNQELKFDGLAVAPFDSKDWNAWIEILRKTQQVKGVDGVAQVWFAIRRCGVDLPTSGDHAEILWPILLRAGVLALDSGYSSFRGLLERILEYAVDVKQRTGNVYPGIYKHTVGAMFGANLGGAKKRLRWWDAYLAEAGLRPDDGIASVVTDALQAPKGGLIHTWRRIYLASGQRNLYDDCIRRALAVISEPQLLPLHRTLISVGDAPSSQMFRSPSVQRLFELDKNRSLPMRTITLPRNAATLTSKTADDVAPGSAAEFAPLTRAKMNTLVGEVHGIKEKHPSDHFVARLFATSAISVDFVLKGLSAFGVETIGPLALKEIGRRCSSCDEFHTKLDSLRTVGIRASDDVYSQMLKKTSRENHAVLWNALLETDQHPESFEDTSTQKRLASSFLHERRWSEAHLALMALSLGGSSSAGQAWNTLLRHYVVRVNERPLRTTFDHMSSQKVQLDQETVNTIYQYLLPTRRPGLRPALPQARDAVLLDFVTRALKYTAEQGGDVSYLMWREILKRYGMAHRWEEVEQLVIWLVDFYSAARTGALSRARQRFPRNFHTLEYRQMRMLHNVFTFNMQQAILVWGFRAASIRRQLTPSKGSSALEVQNTTEMQLTQLHKQPSCEPWAYGLALLYCLQNRPVRIYYGKIRKAFVQRMWILFGPGSSKIPLNNETRRRNRISLTDYIRHANEVWHGFVDWVDPALLSPDTANGKELLIQFFGFRRVHNDSMEFYDIRSWTESLSSSDRIYEKRSVWARRQASKTIHSRLRIVQRPSLTASGTLTTPAHQPPVAHSTNSHPQPSLQYIPAQP